MAKRETKAELTRSLKAMRKFLSLYAPDKLTYRTRVNLEKHEIPIGLHLRRVFIGTIGDEKFQKDVKTLLGKYSLDKKQIDENTLAETKLIGPGANVDVIFLEGKGTDAPGPGSEARAFYALWYCRFGKREMAQLIAKHHFGGGQNTPEFINVGPLHFPVKSFQNHMRVLVSTGDVKVVLTANKKAIADIVHSPELDAKIRSKTTTQRNTQNPQTVERAQMKGISRSRF